MSIQSHFVDLIMDWFRQNRRDLPWRYTNDPYRIWLSEVILQQTRVAQGTPYYQRFLEEFPTVQSLAEADESKVLKLWQGLGYYSRGRSLHQTAQYIVRILGGQFPATSHELLQLKGIGPYTARAIASFAFGEPVAVVDGNVIRVLSRMFDLDQDPHTQNGKRLFQDMADALLPIQDHNTYNQAIMEFGALQCVPRPNCERCPVQTLCLARQMGTISSRPLKSPKKSKKNRYLYYVVPYWDEHTLIRQRTSNDIWKQLYEFPVIEAGECDLPLPRVMELARQHYGLFCPGAEIGTPHVVRHLLTHQVIHAYFWPLRLRKAPTVSPNSDIFAINFRTLEKEYPVPVVLHRFLEQYKTHFSGE